MDENSGDIDYDKMVNGDEVGLYNTRRTRHGESAGVKMFLFASSGNVINPINDCMMSPTQSPHLPLGQNTQTATSTTVLAIAFRSRESYDYSITWSEYSLVKVLSITHWRLSKMAR